VPVLLPVLAVVQTAAHTWTAGRRPQGYKDVPSKTQESGRETGNPVWSVSWLGDPENHNRFVGEETEKRMMDGNADDETYCVHCDFPVALFT
jgi:hypothetical protein